MANTTYAKANSGITAIEKHSGFVGELLHGDSKVQGMSESHRRGGWGHWTLLPWPICT